MGDEFAFLKNNTLSRAELSDSEGAVRNIHYGDILTKFGSVLDGAHVGIPRIMNEETARSLTNDQLRDGDIIVADTAEDEAVGKCTELRELGINKIVSGLHTIPLRPYSRYAPGFLGHYLNSDAYHCQLKPLMQGIKVISISRTALAETQLTVPSFDEQRQIGGYFSNLDALITLHQRERRKAPFSRSFAWEQRKFGELYRPVSEKNDMSFGRDRIISVANMYFNSVVYVTEDSYLATYNVMRLGDIAFEGNRSKYFAHGRFVENTIGDGIVSHVFKVFRPVDNNFDISYWKHAINNEKLMKDVLTRSTKASTMMHELVSSDFLEESTLVPSLDEQRAIGTAIDSIDNLITLHQ